MEIEAERAKQRQSDAGKLGMDIRYDKVGSNEHTLEFEGKARDIVARQIGLKGTEFRGIFCFSVARAACHIPR